MRALSAGTEAITSGVIADSSMVTTIVPRWSAIDLQDGIACPASRSPAAPATTGLPLRVCSCIDLLDLEVVEHAALPDERQQWIGDDFGHEVTRSAASGGLGLRLFAAFNSCSFCMIVVGSCALVMTSSSAIMPASYFSIRKLSSVTMPNLAPVWMSELMRNVLLSRISARDGRRVDHDLEDGHAARACRSAGAATGR